MGRLWMATLLCVVLLSAQRSATANADLIAAGDRYTCATSTVGAVKCWGLQVIGQQGLRNVYGGAAETIPGLRDVMDLSVSIQLGSGDHACAVDDAGRARCWRFNEPEPQPIQGIGDTAALQIAAGQHTCAVLVDGSIRCRGAQFYGQLGSGTSGVSGRREEAVEVSGIDDALKVVVGGEHSCALIEGGQVLCWGRNNVGQLGDNSFTNRNTPVPVSGISNAIDIGAGRQHSCAVLSDGSARCWGAATGGRLGDGGGTNASTPVNVLGIASAQAISVGHNHACVLLEDGSSACWGGNLYGQLGDGSHQARATPVAVTGLHSIVRISAGYESTCARLASGGVTCWGDNNTGQLGRDLFPSRPTAQAVASITSAASVAVGGQTAFSSEGLSGHSCAVLDDAGVRCWGENDYGQLGTGSADATQLATPVEVPGLSGVDQLSLGSKHSCALQQDGEVKCWGADYDGQLGDGGDGGELEASPVSVVGLTDAISLSTRNALTCAVRAGGTLVCWGPVPGFPFIRVEPEAIPGVSDAIEVSVGGTHACVLHANRTVSCFGDNAYGQLGNDSVTESSTPMLVAGLSNVLQLELGGWHSCARLQDQTVRCWGRNHRSQLGNASSEDSATPVSPIGLSQVVQIAAGNAQTCARFADGSASCAGGNDWGQLGDGSFTSRTTMTPIAALADGADIAMGSGHGCAATVDGAVLCWGATAVGQLGNGEARSYPLPTAVADTPFVMYRLDYSAGPNGSLDGEARQAVDSGASGSAVLAVANPGFVFAGWSDGVMANPRTDGAVSSDVNVSATFELAPEGVDLRISFVLPGDASLERAKGGEPIVEIQVLNLGPDDAPQIQFNLRQGRGVDSPSWDCSAPLAGCTPATGSGLPNTVFDLSAGQVASIVLFGSLSPEDNFLIFDAQVIAPAGIELRNPDDDSAHYVAPSGTNGVFLGDFE